MTIASLLTQDVIVYDVTDGAVDDYGNPTQSWAAGATERGRFEQRSGEERSLDQETVISDWVLYLHPDTTVTSRSRVGDAYGRVFEVIGPPAMHSAPNRDVLVEASLRYLEGF
jgi:head-tail adaptor